MKYIINGGVYEVDLKGTSDAEFDGSHPSIIIRSIKNEDMYYIIPLTTYTKERWEKYRKYLCCRILSSNSIARIDKMQLRHKSKIPKRWYVGETTLVIEPKELETVYEKILQYLRLSLETSEKEYKKYYKNYETFRECFVAVFINYNFKDTIFEFVINKSAVVCKCSLSNVTHLSFDDVKRIIWSFFPRNITNIKYDKDTLILRLDTSDKQVLTFMEIYSKINATEGQ